jgi:hypothetical protein
MPSFNTPARLHQSSGVGLSRSAQRSLDRQDESALLQMNAIASAAQIESARVHAIAHVGQQAMFAVTTVSQLEGQLGTMCPMAVTRLQGLGDMTALAVAQVVADLTHRI